MPAAGLLLLNTCSKLPAPRSHCAYAIVRTRSRICHARDNCAHMLPLRQTPECARTVPHCSCIACSPTVYCTCTHTDTCTHTLACTHMHAHAYAHAYAHARALCTPTRTHALTRTGRPTRTRPRTGLAQRTGRNSQNTTHSKHYNLSNWRGKSGIT